MTRLALSILGVDTLIECAEPDTHALLEATYGGMSGVAGRPALRYEIGRLSPSSPYVIRRDGWASVTAKDEAELLWALDDDVVDRDPEAAPRPLLRPRRRAGAGRAGVHAGRRIRHRQVDDRVGAAPSWVAATSAMNSGPVDLDSLTVQPYLARCA